MQYTFNGSEDVTENLPRYVTELNDFSYIKTSYVRFSITLMGISYVFVDETGIRLCFFSMRSWLLLLLIKHSYPPPCSLLFMQQINAENRPRAAISYTFAAQGVTKKGDVCTHVGYAENENGVSPCEWIYMYNRRPTSWILASHIKDSFDLEQVPFRCYLQISFPSKKTILEEWLEGPVPRACMNIHLGPLNKKA